MNVIGTDLSHNYNYHQAYDDYIFYEDKVFEKKPTGGPLDQFTIRLELREIEDMWHVDDIFIEFN